jgi:hypothetical protein
MTKKNKSVQNIMQQAQEAAANTDAVDRLAAKFSESGHGKSGHVCGVITSIEEHTDQNVMVLYLENKTQEIGVALRLDQFDDQTIAKPLLGSTIEAEYDSSIPSFERNGEFFQYLFDFDNKSCDADTSRKLREYHAHQEEQRRAKAQRAHADQVIGDILKGVPEPKP